MGAIAARGQKAVRRNPRRLDGGCRRAPGSVGGRGGSGHFRCAALSIVAPDVAPSGFSLRRSCVLFVQPINIYGGPGKTRTCNQAVMTSGCGRSACRAVAGLNLTRSGRSSPPEEPGQHPLQGSLHLGVVIGIGRGEQAAGDQRVLREAGSARAGEARGPGAAAPPRPRARSGGWCFRQPSATPHSSAMSQSKPSARTSASRTRSRGSRAQSAM
jgi:hypothetical protein